MSEQVEAEQAEASEKNTVRKVRCREYLERYGE